MTSAGVDPISALMKRGDSAQPSLTETVFVLAEHPIVMHDAVHSVNAKLFHFLSTDSFEWFGFFSFGSAIGYQLLLFIYIILSFIFYIHINQLNEKKSWFWLVVGP